MEDLVVLGLADPEHPCWDHVDYCFELVVGHESSEDTDV